MTIWSDLTESERKTCYSNNAKPDKTLTVNLIKKIPVWEAKGRLLDDWNQNVLPEIINIVNQTYYSDQFFPKKRDRQSCPLPVWTLHIVKSKSSPPELIPTIFALHKDPEIARKASKLIETLKNRGATLHLQDYQIAYATKTIKLHVSEDESESPRLDSMHPIAQRVGSPSNEASLPSLCCAKVLIRNHNTASASTEETWTQSTIGACVFIDSLRFGLTTAHGFCVRSPASTHGWEDDNSNDDDALESAAEDNSSNHASPNQDRTLTHQVFASQCDPGTAIDPETLLLPAQHPSPTSIINGSNEAEVDSSEKSKVICNIEYDWALVPVLNPLHGTSNELTLEEGGSLKVRGITAGPTSMKVVIGSAVEPKAWFDFDGITCALSLPHSDRIHVVWRLSQRTVPGDSGALVFDAEGNAFAMVIAGSVDDDETYCLPLEAIFKSIAATPGLLAGHPRLSPRPEVFGAGTSELAMDRPFGHVPSTTSVGVLNARNGVTDITSQPVVAKAPDASFLQGVQPDTVDRSDVPQTSHIAETTHTFTFSNKENGTRRVTRLSSEFVPAQALVNLGIPFYEEHFVQGCRNFVFVEPISEETLEKILDLSREPKEDSEDEEEISDAMDAVSKSGDDSEWDENGIDGDSYHANNEDQDEQDENNADDGSNTGAHDNEDGNTKSDIVISGLDRPTSHERERERTADEGVIITEIQDKVSEPEKPTKRRRMGTFSRKEVLPEALDHYGISWSWSPEDDFYIHIHDYITKDREWELRQHSQKIQQEENHVQSYRPRDAPSLVEQQEDSAQMTNGPSHHQSQLTRFEPAESTAQASSSTVRPMERMVGSRSARFRTMTDAEFLETLELASTLDRDFEAFMMEQLWQRGIPVALYDELLDNHLGKSSAVDYIIKAVRDEHLRALGHTDDDVQDLPAKTQSKEPVRGKNGSGKETEESRYAENIIG